MPLMPAATDWSYVIPGTLATQADVDAPETNWALGEDMSSDVDIVRFWVQDTDPALRLLADLEIQYLIDVWMLRVPGLVYTAAKAAEVISAKFAGVVTVSADGVSVNVADLSERYAQLARRLYQTHKDHEVGGEVDIRNLMWDATMDMGIAPLVFGMGLHDNREAGRQDYGGERFNPWSYAEDVSRG